MYIEMKLSDFGVMSFQAVNLQMVKFFSEALQRIMIISLQPQIIVVYIQASTLLAMES